ncbi:MAG: pyridoxal-phosphate dependent enzyme, partial [Acidimicrobiia bacterium]
MTATISNTETSLGTDTGVRRFDDIRDLLPNVDNPTPLVRLNHVAPNTYLKLEWLNPFGSVKDRAAAYLLAGIIERGELDGRDLVEASSGNTAIALAALAGLVGKRLTVT